MRLAIFHPKARNTIQCFPAEIKRVLGKAIYDLQCGHVLTMPLSRPMSSVFLGVEELRIKDRMGIYRTFYYKKAKNGILIFHAFKKTTQKTPKHEIELAKKRLREML